MTTIKEMLVYERAIQKDIEVRRVKRRMKEKEEKETKVTIWKEGKIVEEIDNENENSLDYVAGLDDEGIFWQLETTLRELRSSRPEERSERSRRYAVTITEMEKVVAYFKTFVVDKG